MATISTKVKDVQHEEVQDKSIVGSGSVIAGPVGLLSLGQVDPALTAKMNIVNDVSAYLKG